MSIICEHVHIIELWKFFLIFGLLKQRSKCAEILSYQFSRISYSGHACKFCPYLALLLIAQRMSRILFYTLFT